MSLFTNIYRTMLGKEQRRKILDALSFINDKTMVNLQYKIFTGNKLDINNPKRYTEKIQWYKLYYRDPLMTQCADKYGVREYVESKGLGHALNDLYGVYDNIDEINFDILPDKFVIKTTNGSGTNLFVPSKQKLDIKETKNKIKKWLNRKNLSTGREWGYNNISAKIIIEGYLEDDESAYEGINDYKFICFNGAVEYIVFDINRFINHKRNFYDKNWNFIDMYSDHPNFGDCVPKPEGLDEMLKIANILAKDFPAVRVDLYWVKGKVLFGELTFYPWSGYVNFYPDEMDFQIGDKFIMPQKLNGVN